MIIRSLTAKTATTPRDWTFGQGQQNFLTLDNAIALAIEMALQIFRGEVFWYSNYGIDWWNILGGTNSTKLMAILEAQARETILGVVGVTAVSQVSATIDSRRNVMLQYQVNTVNGVVNNFSILQQ